MVSDQVISLVVSDTQRELDLSMVSFDVWGTTAHVVMLESVGIVRRDLAKKIMAALADVSKRWERGEFAIDSGLGAQLTLEREVVKHAGEEAGLSMHTARSRNDQVMVTELLYLREQALDIVQATLLVVEELASKASQSVGIPMPGYTHMQPGKPTALSHWYLAHADSLLRGVQSVLSVLDQFDQCPLGSVESFGTSWPIDRLLCSRLLGFSRVWEVPQDAISNRGVFQLALVGAFQQIALVITRIASDLMLYSTFEYRIVQFGDAVAQRLHPVTGSSVMAQKRNPDAVELLRATSAHLTGLFTAISGILSGLPTGYNRDSREVKEYASLACQKLRTAVLSLEQVVRSTQFDAARMKSMVEENYSLTTDFADRLSQLTGLPYRKVYKIVGTAVDKLMTAGIPLTKLTLPQLQEAASAFGEKLALDEVMLRKALSPEWALEGRMHVGGPNSGVTAVMCAERRSRIQMLQCEVLGRIQRIQSARGFTMTLAQAL
jgi:argininosuccinate lyase